MQLLRISMISLAIGTLSVGCTPVSVKETAHGADSITSNSELESTGVAAKNDSKPPEPVIVTKIVEAQDPFADQRNNIVKAINSGNLSSALHQARAMLAKVPESSDDRFLLEAIITLMTEASDNAKLSERRNSEIAKLQETIAQKDEALEKLRQLNVDQ